MNKILTPPRVFRREGEQTGKQSGYNAGNVSIWVNMRAVGDGSDFNRELNIAKLSPVRMSGSIKGPKARKNLAFLETESGAVRLE